MPETLHSKTDVQQCHHSITDDVIGIVALGNDLRRDDGIALAVLDRLMATHCLQHACYFPLGTFSGLLGRCLSSHSRAMIIDSVSSGARPGTINVLDISPHSLELVPARARSSHGFSFIDEVRAIAADQLPRQILFVGIEAADTCWGEEPSAELAVQLPELTAQIATLLISMSKGESVCTNWP